MKTDTSWRDMLALAHPAGIDERAAVGILEQVRAALHGWTAEARTHAVDEGIIARQGERLNAVEQAAQLPSPAAATPRRGRRKP